jgi:MerR family transcriptional regulator, copper efflux regulator
MRCVFPAERRRGTLDLEVDSKVYPHLMRIAEVAERTGFSPATLRYYEQVDLLPPPARTPAGYRSYDESVLDRLAFIARAKGLGCTLEEVAELMPRWDGGRCAPVQAQLRDLAAAKLDETRARTAELAAFAADLERIVAGHARGDG